MPCTKSNICCGCDLNSSFGLASAASKEDVLTAHCSPLGCGNEYFGVGPRWRSMLLVLGAVGPRY